MNKAHIITVTLTCIIIGLYYVTLSPSIAGGDSGELVAEGRHLCVHSIYEWML